MRVTSSCPLCQRRGCDTPADGVLAFDVKLAAFEIDGQDHLARVTDRALCFQHLAEIDARAELRDALDALGEIVDASTVRAFLLPFDHPAVLAMREKGRAA
jgi:hypothetical protein